MGEEKEGEEEEEEELIKAIQGRVTWASWNPLRVIKVRLSEEIL